MSEASLSFELFNREITVHYLDQRIGSGKDFMSKSSLITLLLISNWCITAVAHASDAINQLTGPNSRIWIFTALDHTLGSEQKCSEGREFEFRQNGTLTERVCKDGSISKIDSEWSHQNDGIDDFIMFDGTTYRLILSTQTDKDSGLPFEEAVFRQEGEKTDGTSDLILTRFP